VFVVATRLRVDMQRRRSDRHDSLGARDELLDDDDDPELEYFKRHYREAFRTAFAAALAGLDARERTLLRLHVVHGRSATGIADVYRVHRATAKRWLADIRARLLRDTCARLQQALAVDAAELESIMRLIGSRLEASVRAHLDDATS
jgi:RNA polymerase sigma-70 factor (ECF subfamily)